MATPNRVWIVTAVGEDLIDLTENGVPILLTPELNVRDSPRGSDTNPQLLRFPLSVGRRWTYTTDWLYKEKNSRGTSVVDVTVAPYEKVRVPAGELEAFRLEAKSRMTGLSGIGSRIDAEGTVTYWYAPSAKAVVKSIARNPYLGTSTVELVEPYRGP